MPLWVAVGGSSRKGVCVAPIAVFDFNFFPFRPGRSLAAFPSIGGSLVVLSLSWEFFFLGCGGCAAEPMVN